MSIDEIIELQKLLTKKNQTITKLKITIRQARQIIERHKEPGYDEQMCLGDLRNLFRKKYPSLKRTREG